VQDSVASSPVSTRALKCGPELDDEPKVEQEPELEQDSVQDDARAPRGPAGALGVRPRLLLTGLLATCLVAGLAALSGLAAVVYSAGTWSPMLLLWAVPAGLLGGLGQVALVRWRLAEPSAVLRRFADLADQADELTRQLAERSADRPLGETFQDGATHLDEPAPAAPGRRRAVDVRSANPDTGSTDIRDAGDKLSAVIDQLLTALGTEQSYQSIVEATGDVVLLIDAAGLISLASDSVEQVLGWTPGQLLSQPLARYVHASDLEHLLDLLEDLDSRNRVDRRAHRPRLRLRAADDSWRVLEWVLSQWPSDTSGSTVLTGRDVTDQLALELELRHQSQHDPVTGLPNRPALLGRLTEMLGTATPDRPVAVLMIDLDRFKEINDSLGHAAGDALLSLVGARLRPVLRPGDTLARLGGDEFAVAVRTTGPDGATLVAQRLISQLEDPFLAGASSITVEASIGVAVSHGQVRLEPADAQALMREADLAMFRAKKSGVQIATFEPERDQGGVERQALLESLRTAISSGQLMLEYQPIIDIRNMQVASLEALVRWEHPELGRLQPGEFLPLAEETGLISRLSSWVLDAALAQAAQWRDAGWMLPVSVNLSPTWLHHADLAAEVASGLERYQLPAGLLRLEITEAAVIVDPEQSLARLQRLKEMGVGLSLDDFGTGYSSMTHLRTLPIDQLKVDQTFVKSMATSPADAVIVRAAVELGHKLGLTVVAEGIEDPDALAQVLSAGCLLAQGFYFASPLPASEVLDWIEPRFPIRPALAS
jgi:diguanylate cyclase (GGDEF)-like protein/PAS domain S-box-containing protein